MSVSASSKAVKSKQGQSERTTRQQPKMSFQKYKNLKLCSRPRRPACLIAPRFYSNWLPISSHFESAPPNKSVSGGQRGGEPSATVAPPSQSSRKILLAAQVVSLFRGKFVLRSLHHLCFQGSPRRKLCLLICYQRQSTSYFIASSTPSYPFPSAVSARLCADHLSRFFNFATYMCILGAR